MPDEPLGTRDLSPRISIIIPTLNEERCIAQTLQAIPSSDRVEIIVADGGSCDRTLEIAGRQGARVLKVPGGRARQMNAAARQARGEILLFLHADTRLMAGFSSFVPETLAGKKVVAGAFRLRIDASGWGFRLIERVANWRSRFLHTPYGDQALFLSRQTFREVGGFPDLPIMEDFELVSRLRRKGRIALARQAAATSARRWQRLGLVRTTLINWGMVAGYLVGVSPARLASWYRGHAATSDPAGSRKSGEPLASSRETQP